MSPKIDLYKTRFQPILPVDTLINAALDENEENGAKNADSTIDDCWMTQGRR